MKYKKLPFLGDYIDGTFVFPKNPDGEIFKKDPGDTTQDILDVSFKYENASRACEAAHSAFAGWSGLGLEKRANYLNKLKEVYISEADNLAKIISREVGKPLWESKTEVAAMINKIDVTLSDSINLVKDQKIDNALPNIPGSIRYKPRGALAILGPFNFPGHLPNGQIIAALATGNTVVFKPSELTPATGQMMAQLFERAQFPRGVFNLVHGTGETGRRLTMHDLISGVLFTGSYETGFKIKQDTLPHFWKIIALEMGGKNSSIVWDDCDIRKAVYENIFGSFVTAGQRCTATSRIIVRRSISDEFISKFHNWAKKLSIGYWEDNPFMGPLISASAVDKYIRFQGIAKREGCEPLMRGKIIETLQDGYFVTPSINLVSKTNKESVYQSTEIFGPNVSIHIVDDIEEAIQNVNQSHFGLACSVFSSDKKIYEKVFSQTRMGIVNWNRSTVGASGKMPFGGMGKSGNNEPAGSFTVYTCTFPVATLEDENAFDESKIVPAARIDGETVGQ